MSKISKEERLSLNDVQINLNNPRFPAEVNLGNEFETIMYLLEHSQILNLMEYMLDKGFIRNSVPIVFKEGSNYILEDGNRRLTCLKILNSPKTYLDSKIHSELITKITNSWEIIESLVFCVFEDKKECIDYVEKIHTGPNKGVGLLDWTSEEKQRYRLINGSIPDYATQLLSFLRERYSEDKFKHRSSTGFISTLQRILTSPDARKKLGLDAKNKILLFKFNIDEIFPVLNEIISDLATKAINVSALRDVPSILKYIDSKSEKHKAPLNSLTPPGAFFHYQSTKNKNKEKKKDGPSTQNSSSKKKKENERMRSLPIRADFDCNTFIRYVCCKRTLDVVTEFNQLCKNSYQNSTACLFRIILELTVDNFIESFPDVLNSLDEKAKKNMTTIFKIRKAVEFLEKQSNIKKKTFTGVKSLLNEKISIIDLLNASVHNKHYFPDVYHLMKKWDNLLVFLQYCWKMINEKRESEKL